MLFVILRSISFISAEDKDVEELRGIWSLEASEESLTQPEAPVPDGLYHFLCPRFGDIIPLL
jgi:hypothetical protein